MWCIAELDDEYIEKMEDVLETYERPYDPDEPVVCLDEKPVTLHAYIRPPCPAAPGREARRDSEYERCGTANVFCAVEPKGGRHFTSPTPDRSAFAFACFRCDVALSVPGRQNHSFGDGQPQYPPPEIAGGCIWQGDWRRDLGTIRHPLHPKTRKLAQSSRDRNQPVRPTVLGQKKNPGSKDTPPGSPDLESQHEPEPQEDQLEI